MKGKNNKLFKRYCGTVWKRIKQVVKADYGSRKEWAGIEKQFYSYKICFKNPELINGRCNNRLGCTDYDNHRIYINPNLLNERNIDILMEVLKHEIAHALAVSIWGYEKAGNHGKYFRKVCSYLNISKYATATYTIRYRMSGV